LDVLIPEEHAIPDSPEWFILKWESPGVHKTNRRDHGLFNAQTCKRIKAYAFFESLWVVEMRLTGCDAYVDVLYILLL